MIGKRAIDRVKSMTGSCRSMSNAYFNRLSFGTGGRSSNNGLTVTVFGGYGFIGRYILQELGNTIQN